MPHGCPVAQPPEGDQAPRLKLARGMAAKAIPHPVSDLAAGALAPGRPSTTSPHVGSTPGWP